MIARELTIFAEDIECMTSLFPLLCEPLQYGDEAVELREISRQNRVSFNLKGTM